MARGFGRAVITTLLLVALLFANSADAKYDQIKNIFVIVLENWSYDGLFGFIGDGIDNASATSKTQLDRNNTAYTFLPQNSLSIQQGIPANLPNKPFDLSPYVNATTKTASDLTHSFYFEQMQINNGSMNKYATFSSARGLSMSYYDARSMYLGQLALNYTVFDKWFHASFGGSFLGHQWIITSINPYYPNAPSNLLNQVASDGVTLLNPDAAELQLTNDGYAVNTIQPPYQPYSSGARLPPQNATTIGDLLTAAGISWSWYSGGWNDAVAGNADPTFQYHHQPFNYYSNYAPGTPGRANLKDETDLLDALKSGKNIPQVAFYKPLGKYNYHPQYSIVSGEAEAKLKQVVTAIQESSVYANSAIFITFDEHGGRWDHVAPPKVDRWGPGCRIPTVLISPFAKKKFIDSTVRDTTGIMKFIEDRFNLKNIGTRDAAQPSFDNVFEFKSSAGATIGGVAKIVLLSVAMIALLIL